MTEQSLSPEAAAMLPEATRDVLGLYLGDQLSRMLGTQTDEQRDEVWARAAERFPPFAEKIKALRTGLKGVEITKKEYPQPLISVMDLSFSNIEELGARTLLTDVMWLRLTERPGYLDYTLNSADELDAMFQELGLVGGGFLPTELSAIKGTTVVESVLSDTLHITPQTKIQA